LLVAETGQRPNRRSACRDRTSNAGSSDSQPIANRIRFTTGTGAASGIGKEIARAYRREGAKVVIADLNQAGADAAAAELGGKEAIGVAMDALVLTDGIQRG
jgi:NADP-dependent 3-hydroxy acid dehydrogenase YdfG